MLALPLIFFCFVLFYSSKVCHCLISLVCDCYRRVNVFVNSKSNNNSLFYKIFSMKNLLFFKIVTNRYLKMYSLLIIIGRFS